MEDLLTCTVCLEPFNTSSKRPFDLGCGHSYCEQCISTSPRSFRRCPECRERPNQPHANIALMRLLDAGTNSNLPREQQQPQQQQQGRQPAQQQPPRPDHQPTSAFGPAGVFRTPAVGSEPCGNLGSMLNRVTAAVPAAGSSNTANGGQQHPAAVLASHKANIATLRSAMWVYLTPLLGMLYILSPLDLIPDFIPLVGWIDDALVLYYVCVSVYQLLNSQQQQQR